MKKNKPVSNKLKITRKESLQNNPNGVFEEWDALLFWIHKHYADDKSSTKIPNLKSLLVRDLDVVFDKKVKHVILRNSENERIVYIVAPPLEINSKQTEEERRIYLLNAFSGSLIKLKMEGYSQVKETLSLYMDEEGWETMLETFKHSKNNENK